MTAPERSLAQRMEALGKGNRHRTTRANWKKDVKAGRTSVFTVLADPPAEFESMKVFDALLAVPKIGRVKALSTLHVARVSPSKTLGGLSARQRGELISMLGPGR